LVADCIVVNIAWRIINGRDQPSEGCFTAMLVARFIRTEAVVDAVPRDFGGIEFGFEVV
jgi:hypothetical protein